MIARSLKRKIVVTCGAALGFALLYEVSTLDSRHTTPLLGGEDLALPAPGLRLTFSATAYCRGETTAAGTGVRAGVAAADPTLLPVGSVVQIEAIGAAYNGIYTVLDTGPAVQGREVDIYMWNCDEAVRFGRKKAQLRVLRLGWNPQATGARAHQLFRRREAPPADDAPTPVPPRAPRPPRASRDKPSQ